MAAGSVIAAVWLAAMMYFGQGSLQEDTNKAEAMLQQHIIDSLLRAVHQAKDLKAISIVVVCYDFGLGVAKNEVKAVEWSTKAAEQGHTRVQADITVVFLAVYLTNNLE
eukprot:m.160400 g.160400  ORF g.160400 m.160400 type:complete len:109 (+) comp14350_c0_seq4:66-392(+)